MENENKGVSFVGDLTGGGETGRYTDVIMQFFAYAHLPLALQDVSKPFCDLAFEIVKTLPQNAERTVALRKLLESKDAAVRAKLFR